MKKTFIPIKGWSAVVCSGILLGLILIPFITWLKSFEYAIVTYVLFVTIGLPIIVFGWRKHFMIVFGEKSVTNYMSDYVHKGKEDFGYPGDNYGWTVQLDEIDRVELISGEKIRECNPNSTAKNAIQLYMKDGETKYLPVDGFTKRQIEKILNRLQPCE